jgi:hypothetical protein
MFLGDQVGWQTCNPSYLQAKIVRIMGGAHPRKNVIETLFKKASIYDGAPL